MIGDVGLETIPYWQDYILNVPGELHILLCFN